MIFYTALLFFLASFSSCRAASYTYDQANLLHGAIISESVEVLASVLDQYQGDINARPFFYNGIMLSPLELAAAYQNPEIMSFIIEKKQAVITLESFEIVFASESIECLSALLDHPETFVGFMWAFNRRLFQQILKLSPSYDLFFELVSKFSKRIGFNDKLALIENAFEYCQDRDLISFTVDAVLLDISYTNRDDPSTYDKRAAVIAFARSMIFKHDYDEMLPGIDVQYREYPMTDMSKELINEFIGMAHFFDDRITEYPQPEDVLIKELHDSFSIRLFRFAKNPSLKNGIKVLFRVLDCDEEQLQPDIRACLGILKESRYRAMIRVAKLESMEALIIALKRGVRFNFADIESVNVLLHAAEMGSVERLDLILQNGANPNGSNDYLSLALVVAIKNDSVECVKLLLQRGADAGFKDKSGHTPLYYAIIQRSLESINLLFDNDLNPNDYHNWNGNVPLMIAIKIKAFNCMELLLKRGADPNAIDRNGETPLIVAIGDKWSKGVKLLLDYGADVNFRGRYEDTPLIAAIMNEDIDCMDLLLDRGADPSISNADGETALTSAVPEKSPECLRLLLEMGADPNVANTMGRTALYYAVEAKRYDLVEILLVYGANP